ncbi:AI-2E family transporter [Williamsia sp. CHRR-6]|uniref:AI-2E family transporter n=1 Tax=Williamsia sp. CHRR-6 TaxID=2835871 RepID=UPI001BD9FBDF|nr:AI-2E family transporter [Williamsia sp. CHRR-6]MBT0567496.1 AI-2E family transporter [Williamsia sp. CHRR-6]
MKHQTASTTDDRLKVHPLVRATSEWSWRLIVIAVAVYVLARVALHFEEVVVPVALAVLGTALLVPAVDWLDRRGVHRGLAVAVTMVVAVSALGGILAFVVDQFIAGLPDLSDKVTKTIDSVKDWLVDGPLHLKQAQIDKVGNDITEMIQRNQDKITSGAIATATTVTQIVTGALLTLFLMIFFLFGGGQIWTFLTRAVPRASRAKVWEAGRAGFGTLVGYVRATVAVALVDALGIGIGLAILQVPLALPLASLVFIGAFVPIVGALVTGALAVLVALVTKGLVAAAISLIIVVAVMQVESHVLQPFLLGRSVRLHPVAVVLGIAAGIVTAGIIGGLLAVPLIAFLNTAIRSLHHQSAEDDLDEDREAARIGMFTAKPDAPLWDDPEAPGRDGPIDADAAARADAEDGTLPAADRPD